MGLRRMREHRVLIPRLRFRPILIAAYFTAWTAR